MVSNFREFSKQLDKAQQEKIFRRVKEFRDTIVISIYREIVKLAPVWSGSYRLSVNVSGNTIDKSIVTPSQHPEFPIFWPEPFDNPFNATPIAQVANDVRKVPLKQTVFIANSVPYARRIEFGHSKQSPDGVFILAADTVIMKFKSQIIKV